MATERGVWVVLRPDRRPSVSRILPNLSIGEYPTCDDVEWLRATHSVTAVVNLQDHADLSSKGLKLCDLQEVYRRHAMHFHHIPIPDGDSETLRARLDGLVDLLAELVSAGERVYLHCNGGFNRAPTVCIAYLHAAQQMPLAEAVRFVKDRRPCVPYLRVLETQYGPR